MITSQHKRLQCALIALIIGVSIARAGDRTVTGAKLEATAAKSAFVDDANSGKDPFFPESRRRTVAPTRVPTNNVPQVNLAVDQLIRLKGISGTKEQRLALLNNKTFAEGETGELKTANGVLKVKCREIRDGYVLIEIPGVSEVRELRLRDGVY